MKFDIALRRFVKRQPWLGAKPVNELANRMIVGALRTGRGQTVEHGRFRLFKFRELQDGFGSRFRFAFAFPPVIATASFKPWQQR
jgi:hypothetical protein